MTEIVDLEGVPYIPEIYPHLNQISAILGALPNLKDIVYFKTQMLRNEIEDVQ